MAAQKDSSEALFLSLPIHRQRGSLLHAIKKIN
jgi:hypothetical protein